MSSEVPGLRGPAADASEDLLRQIEQELSGILNILEGRFLYLVRESGRGAIPPEAVVGELTFLSRDLAACFRRLGEIEFVGQGRNDSDPSATGELAGFGLDIALLQRRFFGEVQFALLDFALERRRRR